MAEVGVCGVGHVVVLVLLPPMPAIPAAGVRVLERVAECLPVPVPVSSASTLPVTMPISTVGTNVRNKHGRERESG